MSESASGTSKRRNRSPQYPAIDLAAAVERARELHSKEGLHEIPVPLAAKHWGYSAKSSTGIRTVAALIHYGLLEDQGSGDDRKVWLSDLARQIILDDRKESPERERAYRIAALNPQIFRDLWTKYGHGKGLPSDENLRVYLKRDLAFNPKKVNGLIDDFKATVEFAGLDATDMVNEVDEEEDEEASLKPSRPIDFADMVAWNPGLRRERAPVKPADTWSFSTQAKGGTAVIQIPAHYRLQNLKILSEALKHLIALQEQVEKLTSEDDGASDS